MLANVDAYKSRSADCSTWCPVRKPKITNSSHKCRGYYRECGSTISGNKRWCKSCADLAASA